MTDIWSDASKLRRWLEIELLATEAHAELGIVPAADAATCREQAPTVDAYPDRSDVLARVEPVYKTLPGWRTDLSATREPGGLPGEARTFLALVEQQVGVPVKVVGVGAERDDYLLWTA